MKFEIDVVSESDKWIIVRWNRNSLIEQISFMLDDGVPITANHRLQVLAYIQDLRDIPQHFSNADDVEFPDPPYYEKGIPPTEKVFPVPIKASTMTAEDFIVQSPKPKEDPLEALAEAVAEAAKDDKSLAVIVLNMLVFIKKLKID